MNRSTLVAVVAGLTGSAMAQVTLDFEEFSNGNAVSASMGVTISDGGVGPGLGPTAFDSAPGGPNASGGDTDLLVDLGMLLMVQNNAFPTQTVGGTFDTANDEESGGQIDFDFSALGPVTMTSIVLVDIDGAAATEVRLIDTAGLVRTYSVPDNWTNDVDSAPDGYDTLDLTTLAGQLGEGGATATASEDAGFNPALVVSMEVEFAGSGALDAVMFVPAPGSIAFGALGVLFAARRRR